MSSPVASAVYTLKVATPTLTPGGGTYPAFQTVTVSCPTAGAAIHYTTTGLEPTESDPVIASGGTVFVDRNLTLKAKSWRLGWTASDAGSAAYVIYAGTIATPTFSKAAGTYTTPQTVAISCATAGATIRYTTDGSTPTETTGSPIASGGTVLVDRTLTLKAEAWKPAWTASAVMSAVYTMKVATPTFSPDGGGTDVAQNVRVTCATPGATIHYTTNGLTPTESSPVVASGSTVLVDHTLTLKAAAWRSGWTTSGIKSAAFEIGSGGGGDNESGPNQ